MSRRLPVLDARSTYSEVSFQAKLASHGLKLRAAGIHTLQVNVGKLCNQACKHCHVDAGPSRTEMSMRVEEAGQESPSLAINQLRGRRNRDIRADGANHTGSNEDGRAANYARAIEHVHLAEHKRLLRLLSRRGRK